MSRLRVALVFGGKSSEHEISVISARAVAEHIDPHKYETVPLYIARNGTWYEGAAARSVLGLDVTAMLKSLSPGEVSLRLEEMTRDREQDRFRLDFHEKNIDVAFPVLHGAYGEDGRVQGVFEILGIPYTGCGVQASAITMDKAVTKICAIEAGVAVAPFVQIQSRAYIENPAPFDAQVRRRFTPPFFVKPANLGSSVGISKVHAEEEFQAAMQVACRLDTKVLVERAVSGREVEVAVLGNDRPMASLPGEIEPGSDFYDYTDKYITAKAKLFIPARIDRELQEAVMREAITVYRALGCAGLSRIDFFIENQTGKIILNEVNTIPGFTPISMYPMLMEKSGVGFTELVDRLILLALEKTSP
ncbi:D-alanine--D-alanine ligase [Prosthecochloris sp. GSB1]|uniref:D-alanine--D-alanine ligase family protein n=1 Tax=Prosthecochloris sp. GSB1 TaxID=281093 RepID=UPI000B8CA194|nr:D-alanine--D-alanine ligase family protein [Prosthecochloris sp. GSB1]ASQ90204.1 D-alanine--D-alanine ligase [Prosthecochloris sp. GSB1]